VNRTPRTTNRILLAILGLILTCAGVHGLLLAGFPGYARDWQGLAHRTGDGFADMLRATTLEGQRDSWLWILIAVAMIVLILLMVWWIAVQGQGKTGVFAREYHDNGATRGIVEVASGVPEQLIRNALAGRPDLVSVSVTAWDAEHDAGLRIKIQPRLGAAPYRIADDVSALVMSMDEVLGRSGPVVIHLAGGARTRMARAERVR
jgi:hypothetical protein